MIKADELLSMQANELLKWEDIIDNELIRNSDKVITMNGYCYELPNGMNSTMAQLIAKKYSQNGYEAKFESYQRDGSWIRFRITK